MNETPDGTEPLGENPEVSSYFHALDNATALITAAKRDAQIIEELRELHSRRGDLGMYDAVCRHCEVRGVEAEWPCETMRIIDAVRL